MARRNPTAVSDLLAIAARLPPWASLGIAAVTHVLLRWIAAFEVPAPARMEDLGDMILRLAFVIFAQFGQYVLPLVFVSGAVLSFVKQRRSGRLLDTFGRGAHGDHAAPWSPTWREFEMLVGELYRRKGFVVRDTSSGADGGVDLVLRRGEETHFVQCKHWRARTVGVKVVRELKGVIAAEGARGGALVTSGRFTADAVEFATAAGIDLIDGQRLQALAEEAAHRSGAQASVPAALEEAAARRDGPPRCPRCAADMVLRTARRGINAGKQFFGCSRYPACKGSAPAGAPA